jgi:hypothetical protein
VQGLSSQVIRDGVMELGAEARSTRLEGLWL